MNFFADTGSIIGRRSSSRIPGAASGKCSAGLGSAMPVIAKPVLRCIQISVGVFVVICHIPAGENRAVFPLFEITVHRPMQSGLIGAAIPVLLTTGGKNRCSAENTKTPPGLRNS